MMPCTPARARMLLKSHKAAILRRFPLVLILRAARPEAVVEPLRVKLDPGASTAGLPSSMIAQAKSSGLQN